MDRTFSPKSKLFTVMLFVMTVRTLRAEDTSLPRNMAALGDSITAGAFAAYTRTDGVHPSTYFKVFWMFLRMGISGTFLTFEDRKRSWATGVGDGVISHATRLKELNSDNNVDFKFLNAAVTGSNSQEMDKQVDNVLKWSKATLKQGAPDYVLMDIGANDLCGKSNRDMTSVENYSSEVKGNLERILKANPQARILIGGLPDIDRLRMTAADSPVSHSTTCTNIWRTHKFCQNMLLETDADKIAEINARESAYMHELETIKEDLNQEWGDDHVRFATGIYDYKFTDNQISIDCFHPNRYGQQALSDVSWQESWWSGLAN